MTGQNQAQTGQKRQAATVQALRASQQVWAVVEVRGEGAKGGADEGAEMQAWVQPAPSHELLAQYLSRVDVEWALEWQVAQVQPPVVGAVLTIGGVRRGGLAAGHTLRDAKLLALADAALAFGLPAAEGQWVAYDPEDGADTALLEAEAVAQAEAAAPASLPPEPPKDPQMEKARAHIDDLMEQINAADLGHKAVRIVAGGYGETLEERREIYRQLKAVLQEG